MSMPRETSSAPAVLRECGICQSAIFPAEETILCPSCRLAYHAECWLENLGCASYGCDKVNALAPAAEPALTLEPPPFDQADRSAPPSIPWSFLLLGAATISLLLAPLTFGVPSMITLIAAAWRGRKLRSLHDGVLMGAIALSLAGVAAGVMLSHLWWGQVG